MDGNIVYKRIVLKLSGEAMAGEQGFGFDAEVIDGMARQVAQLCAMGVDVALVVGGGNIWRGGAGSERLGLARATGDYMGMLATVMNGLALQGAMERHGIAIRVQSAIAMPVVCETYIRQSAIDHLTKGRVVIFVAGTGNPFFTTDTTAVLRAAEIEADLVIKATQVDGVYSADPHKDSTAQRFSKLTHEEYLQRGLRVLDLAAVALSQEHNIPVIVLSMSEPDSILRAVCGEEVGTLIGRKGVT